MPYVLLATPEAQRSIDNLRGDPLKSLEQKLRDVKSHGCGAFDYRLTAYESNWLCCAHLCRDYRLVAILGNDDEIIIWRVGRHTRGRGSDFYRQIFDDLGLRFPASAPRTKPPCCGRPSEMVESAADIDAAVEHADALEPKTKEGMDTFLGGAKELKLRERRARR